MSINPSLSPIIREVKIGGKVMFNNQVLQHDELIGYEGSDVLLDMEVDVRTEERCFRVYDMWENEICVIELDKIDHIGQVIS